MEYQQFNQDWDQQMMEIEKEHDDAVGALEEKHVR